MKETDEQLNCLVIKYIVYSEHYHGKGGGPTEEEYNHFTLRRIIRLDIKTVLRNGLCENLRSFTQLSMGTKNWFQNIPVNNSSKLKYCGNVNLFFFLLLFYP